MTLRTQESNLWPPMAWLQAWLLVASNRFCLLLKYAVYHVTVRSSSFLFNTRSNNWPVGLFHILLAKCDIESTSVCCAILLIIDSNKSKTFCLLPEKFGSTQLLWKTQIVIFVYYFTTCATDIPTLFRIPNSISTKILRSDQITRPIVANAHKLFYALFFLQLTYLWDDSPRLKSHQSFSSIRHRLSSMTQKGNHPKIYY